MSATFAVGLDFGTESVRALVVNTATGQIAAQAVRNYPHGVIDRVLPKDESGVDVSLPPDYALQDPKDWLAASGEACREAIAQAKIKPEQVIGVGVDFTSCTMMPAFADGTPVCCYERFSRVPLAWPKLWKHHAAKAATDRINAVARERGETWLQRYGGTIGIEWFFPKILETLEEEPGVYDITDVWIEAGDWYVWQLVSGPFPNCSTDAIARSTCQAGYKAQWNAKEGYPSADYFAAVHPKLADVMSKMPGTLKSPGTPAGTLTQAAAELLGLKAGTPVSTATIDAHAGVPGAGVAEAGTIVLVMGTSSCHMLNGTTESLAPGIAGVVDGGILPGFFGYETGQSSVGDAFAWLVESFGLSHAEMNKEAATLPPGSGGVLALDWLNGCRTPLMDGRLSGSFVGLTLGTRPAQMYRALMEATALGVRWIVDTLRDGGVAVEQYVASGGLPAKSPLLMQIYADVLGAPIRVAASDQSCGLGAAILGAAAAKNDPAATVKLTHAMAPQGSAVTYHPDADRQAAYDALYQAYRTLANPKGDLANVMRQLSALR